VGAEIKVTYNMLAQNKIRGVGTTAGHTGFCGAARKKYMHTLPHQGSESSNTGMNGYQQKESGKFPLKTWLSHFSCKYKVVSCTFHHPTGYRSHQKLHVFERVI